MLPIWTRLSVPRLPEAGDGNSLGRGGRSNVLHDAPVHRATCPLIEVPGERSPGEYEGIRTVSDATVDSEAGSRPDTPDRPRQGCTESHRL